MNDYDEIRNLIGNYSLYANDKNIEAYQALFSKDGELVENGMTFSRAVIPALSNAYNQARAEQPQPFGGKHLQMNIWIEVDGDKARAKTDLVIINIRPDTGWIVGNTGRCTDELVKEDGAWRFRRRTVTFDHALPPNPRDDAFHHRVKELVEKALA